MTDQKLDSPSRPWPTLALALLAMVGAGLLRFVPWPIRPPNFAAVGALSLYAGARLPWWIAPFVPLAVMFVTDDILYRTFLWGPRNYYVYASYVITVVIGMLLRRTESAGKIAGATFASSLIFFLVTNLGVWLQARGGSTYADSLQGLLTCYVAGLPFYGWTLLSDLSFAMVFFGAHGWLIQSSYAAAGEATGH